jgi:Ca2+-binding RTX toxin-like protein
MKRTGNRSDNRLSGGRGDDTLRGKDGNDVLRGLSGEDHLSGGNGRDHLLGGRNGDFLDGGRGADRLDGGHGSDQMAGGSGDDVYIVEWTGHHDLVFETAGEGHDRVLLSGFNYQMTANVEDLWVVNGLRGPGGAIGNDLDNEMRLGDSGGSLAGGGGDDRLFGRGAVDVLRGGDGADLLKARSGADHLFGDRGRDRLDGGGGDDALHGGGGRDRLEGGKGDDVLSGDGGRDRLIGGAGADTFLFDRTGDSGTTAGSRDTIADFDPTEDIIDLSGIDAREASQRDNAFSFIGDTAFTGQARQLSFRDGILAGDTDGDGRADFKIEVSGGIDLTTDHFIL